MTSKELAGQVAVVTGGGRGFGRAIAMSLGEAGAAVCVTARRSADLDETVAAITAAGGRAIAVPGDVRVRGDLEEARRQSESAFGSVTIVVSNAGVSWPFGPLSVVDPDRWWEAHAIHVRGALNCIAAFVPGMIERREGRVIVVSSGSGTRVGPNHSGYGVPKNAQNRLVEHLAEEARPHNVYAWPISPGGVVTELAETTMNDPDAQKYLPDVVARTRQMREEEDAQLGLSRCGRFCVELASGRHDVLSGRFLRATDDLAAMTREAIAMGDGGA